MTDHTTEEWMSMFDQASSEFFETPAENVMKMWHKKEEDPGPFETWANSKNYKRVKLRCKAKMEDYNDQPSVKIEVHGVDKFNYQLEAEGTLASILADSGSIDDALEKRGFGSLM